MTALFRLRAKTLLLRIHIQAVLNDICWYARHIFMSSSKYVLVTPQKVDDFFLCLEVQTHPYLGRLCWISLDQLNRL